MFWQPPERNEGGLTPVGPELPDLSAVRHCSVLGASQGESGGGKCLWMLGGIRCQGDRKDPRDVLDAAKTQGRGSRQGRSLATVGPVIGVGGFPGPADSSSSPQAARPSALFVNAWLAIK